MADRVPTVSVRGKPRSLTGMWRPVAITTPLDVSAARPRVRRARRSRRCVDAFTSCAERATCELCMLGRSRVDAPPGNVTRRDHLGELGSQQAGSVSEAARRRRSRRSAPREPGKRPEQRRLLRRAVFPTKTDGSGTAEVEDGPATGFDEPITCASLSRRGVLRPTVDRLRTSALRCRAQKSARTP